MYEIRTRTWWRDNPDWPNGLEPSATPWDSAHKIGTADTESEARQMCRDWNATHKPGRLSRKAEFSET